jgi:hypothetical protein
MCSLNFRNKITTINVNTPNTHIYLTVSWRKKDHAKACGGNDVQVVPSLNH